MLVKTQRLVDGSFAAHACCPRRRWTSSVCFDVDEVGALAGAQDLVQASLAAGKVNLLVSRQPVPGESYEGYLGDHGLLGGGFEYGEIVRPRSYEHERPPRRLWANIVPALALAHWIRERAVGFGSSGLSVNAAYRPASRLPGSKHRLNAALDLDLLSGEYGLGGRYLELAADLYAAHEHLRVGVGTYGSSKSTGTIRIHVDAKVRSSRKCWQKSGRSYVRPPAVLRIHRARGD